MKLVLFFSRGVSLKLWIEKGIFDREKLLYEEHLKQNNLYKVYWLTYGYNDEDIAKELKKNNKLHHNIEVLQMPKIFCIPKIGTYLYSLYVPFIYRNILKDSDIFKTNQTDGSWSAVIAKKLYDKKLLYRTGFTMSQLENKLKRFNVIARKAIEWFEEIAYKNCDKAIVASSHNLEYVKEKYKVINDKADIIYNFIDRKSFYDFYENREDKVVFIGRLSDEKNIYNLILALNNLNLPLEIYGSGPLKNGIATFIKKNNYNVRLMGNVSNNQLPQILNKVKYFTLVSKHEGMPKALIEGMACGCLCVGTDVTGINEVIVNNHGILAKDISSKEITNAFKKIMSLSKQEIADMKLNVKYFIDQNFTLEYVVKKERKIFKELSAK